VKCFFYAALLSLALASGGSPVFAQQAVAGAKSLESLLTELQTKLTGQALPAKEKYDTLAMLARARRLGGDLENAAKAWNEAALAAEGANASLQSNAALLEAARCKIAMGEFAGAKADIGRVLQASGIVGANDTNGTPNELQRDAVNLASMILLFENGTNPLRDNLTQFSASNALPSLEALPSPYWLLFPGRANVSLQNDDSLQNAVAQNALAQQAPASASGTVPVSSTVQPGQILQTGLFTAPSNAQSQADKLKTKGFTPSITERTLSGKTYYAVTVAADTDTNTAIMKLKDAGFEAFPVF
jgi:hypothetical protein